ncbi:MAG: hypothetical protein U5L08_06700 [Xanthomonadales bacterium]|nr:hypothetical protein [Xanthomonadales bacterium]
MRWLEVGTVFGAQAMLGLSDRRAAEATAVSFRRLLILRRKNLHALDRREPDDRPNCPRKRPRPRCNGRCARCVRAGSG